MLVLYTSDTILLDITLFLIGTPESWLHLVQYFNYEPGLTSRRTLTSGGDGV